MTQSIVIIGAGECGARAALALRANGFDGAITLIGRERHLPYERPPLSKATLHGDAGPTYVTSTEKLAELAIETITGVDVESLDPIAHCVTLSDGRSLPYSKALITTGAKPRRLPSMIDGSTHILTLRTYEDCLAIRNGLGEGKHLAIIGGGFIGLEIAATARKSGTRVTLIEGLPRILSRGVPAEIAEIIATRHIEEGVDLICGASISNIAETENGVEISLAGSRTIIADKVIVGIGASPDIALAEKAGLEIVNGIAVNERLETSAADIYAAGDCCSFPLSIYGGRRVRLEAWRNAQDQGELAALNLIGRNQEITSVPWFWSDQYDLTLQVAGLSEGSSESVRRDLGDDAFILFHLDGDGRLLSASGIARGNAIAKDMRLAEMMIATKAMPDKAALANPAIKLKSLVTR
jgi:3-phenylpropionate/trans-cinnamate dioxygenase ferredoxin reductase subunit